jgi:segregation and condensation protein A
VTDRPVDDDAPKPAAPERSSESIAVQERTAVAAPAAGADGADAADGEAAAEAAAAPQQASVDAPEGSAAVEVASASAPAEPAEGRNEEKEEQEENEGLLPLAWRVRLPVFEGPLDLLLHLIKINQVEISDIPVSLICDQFHAYLALMDELNLDVAGEYIYEAALLIHLKSKLLLPRPSVKPGEPEPEDPRQDLVNRLLEYRKLKEVAQSLAEVDRMRAGIWTRPRQPLPQAEPESGDEVDLGEISLFDLLGALKAALVRYDKEHPPPLLVSTDLYTVRSQFDRLLACLAAGWPYDLLGDLRTRTCRAEAIATFLAILELARLNLIRVHQTDAGEILVYRTTRELDAEDHEALV